MSQTGSQVGMGVSSLGELSGLGGDACFVVDINECLQPEASCGPNAICENSEGSYSCMCNLGYKLLSGAESFANRSENTCHGKSPLCLTSRMSASGSPEYVLQQLWGSDVGSAPVVRSGSCVTSTSREEGRFGTPYQGLILITMCDSESPV